MNWTLHTGAVGKPHLPGEGECSFIFRIHYKAAIQQDDLHGWIDR